MPQVNTVNKARKDQGPCGCCAVPIKAGDSYVWWKPNRESPRQVRCESADCYPAKRDLTASDFDREIWDIEEAIEKVPDGLSLIPLIRRIRTAGKKCEEKVSNMPVGCQSNPVAELLTARFEACEDWAAELEAQVREFDQLEDIEDEPDTEGVITEQQFEEWRMNLPVFSL